MSEAHILARLQHYCSPARLAQLLQLRHELLDWNTRLNLTAITDPEEVLLKHILDSLSLLEVYHAHQARVLDIGSGAGFPGLPLAIARPDWEIVLLEGTGKKVHFQQHIIQLLALPNVEALHGRAEELAHRAEYRACFDLITARAVAALPRLLEYAAPFVRPGGQILLHRKGDLPEELAEGKRAAQMLGLTLHANLPVMLPGLDDGRRLLVWQQTRLCPAHYPRSGALIAKRPLGVREQR